MATTVKSPSLPKVEDHPEYREAALRVSDVANRRVDTQNRLLAIQDRYSSLATAKQAAVALAGESPDTPKKLERDGVILGEELAVLEAAETLGTRELNAIRDRVAGDLLEKIKPQLAALVLAQHEAGLALAATIEAQARFENAMREAGLANRILVPRVIGPEMIQGFLNTCRDDARRFLELELPEYLFTLS